MARVLVAGAGGVGGAFGAAMSQAGHDVVFLARGENLQALRTKGLTVTGKRPHIELNEVRATDDSSEVGERDLVLLTVKSYDLEVAVKQTDPCGGIVVTLQNGVDAAERAAAIVGDRVLAGSTGIGADLVSPGHIDVFTPYSRITFGEPSGVMSDRTRLVDSWLRAGGWIDSDPQEDVRIPLWEKMSLICGMAGLTTLYRCPIGPILDDPAGSLAFERILEEVIAVGRASGVNLSEDAATSRREYASRIPPEGTSSMYRDLQRGKRLELEHLTGYIVSLGRELGVDVPVNETVYAGIRIAANSRSGSS